MARMHTHALCLSICLSVFLSVSRSLALSHAHTHECPRMHTRSIERSNIWPSFFCDWRTQHIRNYIPTHIGATQPVLKPWFVYLGMLIPQCDCLLLVLRCWVFKINIKCFRAVPRQSNDEVDVLEPHVAMPNWD